MNNYVSRLLSKYERPASFLAPASYLIAMALVIGKLDISLYLKIASSIPLIAFGMLAFPGFTDHLNRQTRAAILAVGLGGIAAVLCYRLNNLWIDHHGFNGARLGLLLLFAQVPRPVRCRPGDTLKTLHDRARHLYSCI